MRGKQLRASSVQLITGRPGARRRSVRDLPTRPDEGAGLVRSPRTVRNHRGADDDRRGRVSGRAPHVQCSGVSTSGAGVAGPTSSGELSVTNPAEQYGRHGLSGPSLRVCRWRLGRAGTTAAPPGRWSSTRPAARRVRLIPPMRTVRLDRAAESILSAGQNGDRAEALSLFVEGPTIVWGPRRRASVGVRCDARTLSG